MDCRIIFQFQFRLMEIKVKQSVFSQISHRRKIFLCRGTKWSKKWSKLIFENFLMGLLIPILNTPAFKNFQKRKKKSTFYIGKLQGGNFYTPVFLPPPSIARNCLRSFFGKWVENGSSYIREKKKWPKNSLLRMTRYEPRRFTRTNGKQSKWMTKLDFDADL